MLARAAERIRSFGPWPEGRPVLLACSGGADSTFLACAWRYAVQEQASPRAEGGLDLPEAQIVVVDHGHRPGSREDALQAQGLYSKLGFSTRIQPVSRLDGTDEASLRQARYQVLTQVAEQTGASAILLAHHADDQAETVLLRILRGTGLHGLQGIPARRPLTDRVDLLRPLLDFETTDLRSTLEQLGQPWIEDPTNADPGVAARNHLRQHALPALQPLASASPAAALRRLAEEARDWAEAKQALLAEDRPWTELPSYLRRWVIRGHLQDLGATVSPARLRDLEGALLRRASAAIDAHHRLELRRGRLHREPTSCGGKEEA